MRLYIILLMLCLFGCAKKEETQIKNSAKKNVEYSINSDSMTTPNGNVIKFRKRGSIFQMQWHHGSKLETLEHKFVINGPDAHKPRFVAENRDYILLRAGCGNPCWLGFFLPLKMGGSAKIINEYLAYDLDQNLVVYINEKDELQVFNFKTSKSQAFPLDECQSEFRGYCIDTIYFEKNELNYKLISKTSISSDKGKLIKLKIDI